jgi:glyoxylase-like metal-dependent hydrolase (beta-lactamase superfamily II)
MVVPCYLIRHPKGDLMWDTGLPDLLAFVPGGIKDGPVKVTLKRRVRTQLADLGLGPADIDFLSVSHSHADHIGNGNMFAKTSTWIVDAEERAYAFRSEARANQREFSGYADLERARTVLIEGDGDHDVFGDGSVTIVQAPGHTPGHAVLLVRLPQSGPVLLTGDLWHLAESREAQRVPRFNTDRAQTLASYEKIERLARETGARVVRQHVPEDFAALPRFPEPMR